MALPHCTKDKWITTSKNSQNKWESGKWSGDGRWHLTGTIGKGKFQNNVDVEAYAHHGPWKH
eukprot:NODE_16620_length_220_cov_0.860606.p1 GENE.NODE_16620_length_220_cov_0.860606~~NODE_16620_length_220_cov_0.860606.p1  ORF type:complete len:62 (-),score=12.31 NODE_16620_length_220_cov_0.860606:33-218(-)